MKGTELPGLRRSFARGKARQPLHRKLFNAIKRCVSWQLSNEPKVSCKTHGHKFDLKKWSGPRNSCEECGKWITSPDQVRPEEERTYLNYDYIRQTSKTPLLSKER